MESETDGQAQQPVATASASARMRAAREAAGLQLAEVAARTRVPLRHLEALERGDYAALPGITYCAGFTRAYARAVGLDEKALVAQVREEIDRDGDFAGGDQYQIDEPADPARVPPRWLAWVAALIALLLAGGYALWRMQLNTPPDETIAAPAEVAAPRPSARPAAPAPVTGPVVLTAVEDVWLRIYDADGKTLFLRTLPKGESYTVPADAKNPMILTGRADALAVTVGGRPVPPLGTAERTISDVPVSAQALLARGAAPANGEGGVPVPAAAPAPAPTGQTAPPAARPAPAPRTTRPPAERRPSAEAPRPAAPEAAPAAPAPAPAGNSASR